MAVYLIGDPTEDFERRDLRFGTKFPDKLQVLKVYFYFRNVMKKGPRESASSCIRKLVEVWSKEAPNVALREHRKCVLSLEKLVDELKNLEKSKNRQTKTQASNETSFVQGLTTTYG
ncbi:Lazarillo protein [Frankliniella fusca]|uniref:Lazarillo protein n=1 Tax=Frankliniella fusca TaxID=407009 RepID=A0AAE1I2J7_9NEOP|nr:Lazarillo protein [Frankliniella fusca]KAK3931765.1 Lazarillo protein [Frankliniella fusca]